MATRKYGKVPLGHPFGSQLGVHLTIRISAKWLLHPSDETLQAFDYFDVHEEWIRNLLANRPDLTREKLERTRQLMDKAAPHGLVTGDEYLIAELRLPDPNDRHVLGAAIHCRASVIVTRNLADFPSDVLAEFGSRLSIPMSSSCVSSTLRQVWWSRQQKIIARA